MTKDQKETIEQWKRLIRARDAWALKALDRIFSMQTADEQSAEVTVHKNRVGFTAFDAEILTRFARRRASGYQLGPYERALVRKMMPKYAAQLYRLTHPHEQVA